MVTLRKWWGDLRHTVCLLLFADIVHGAICEAIHPEFGWIWRDDGDGGRLTKRYEEAQANLVLIESRLIGLATAVRWEIGNIKTLGSPIETLHDLNVSNIAHRLEAAVKDIDLL
jgi:hypothetical protein